MFYDISNFLLIFFVLVIGFGGAMYSAAQAAVGTVAVCLQEDMDAGLCKEDADLISSSLGDHLGPAVWIIRSYFRVFGELALGESRCAVSCVTCAHIGGHKLLL